MSLSKDELNLKVVVSRVATGATPYGWELHGGDTVTRVHVSPARFRSMEAAYTAGQAGVAEYMFARQLACRKRPVSRGMNRRPASTKPAGL